MTNTQPTPLPPFWPLFLIALGTRLVVVLVGIVIASMPPILFPDDPVPMQLRTQILSGSASPIEPWYRWDADWYVTIATQGYAEARDNSGYLGVAFLPALPICLAAADYLGINLYWAGLVLVNLAAAAGTAVFTRVAVRLTSDRNLGLRTFILLLAFPSSFFSPPPITKPLDYCSLP